ncbi:MAG: exodeoxyribonuclease VII large subunit [Candidatus Latescibacteria bacterium]|nr:exodeoxyribonuclease VII large subunit [bacterium]MBD3423695.1 exodeoxyribonuclease VII large subunit [Candidatus Latescibacterota bacterium]
MREEIYTVSEIAEALRQNLEATFHSVNIMGEIANFKIHNSGHIYFTLRDERSMINAVIFRNYIKNIPFGPDSGMMVYARGRITHYGARGQTQLLVYYMEPAGRGELELQMKKLVEKLRSGGYLRDERKRGIPSYPSDIAVVTSISGSVIEDIRDTLARRWPLARMTHFPADVQGSGASESLVRAIGKVNSTDGIDLLILARGGGSIEDLWAFNTEPVAMAVAESRYPVITGIGHETDTTVCDLVADTRAATPTAAAELAVPDRDEVEESLVSLNQRLDRAVAQRSEQSYRLIEYLLNNNVFPAVLFKLERSRFILDDSMERLHQHIRWYLREAGERTDRNLLILTGSLKERLSESRDMISSKTEILESRGPSSRISALNERLTKWLNFVKVRSVWKQEYLEKELEGKLRALADLNPSGVLRRGYAICTDMEGSGVISDVENIDIGDRVAVHFHDGNIGCEVKERKIKGDE